MSKIIIEIETDELDLDKIKKFIKGASMASFRIDGFRNEYPIKKVISTCEFCKNHFIDTKDEMDSCRYEISAIDKNGYCENWEIKE